MVLCVNFCDGTSRGNTSVSSHWDGVVTVQHKSIIPPNTKYAKYQNTITALPPSPAPSPLWQRTRSCAGWRVMFFAQQSSSAVLLASQGHVYLAKIKAASCIIGGGGGTDPGPFAVVGADKWKCKEKASDCRQELDYRWRVFLLGITNLDLQPKELRCLEERVGAHQTDKACLLLYIVAPFAKFWICL